LRFSFSSFAFVTFPKIMGCCESTPPHHHHHAEVVTTYQVPYQPLPVRPFAPPTVVVVEDRHHHGHHHHHGHF